VVAWMKIIFTGIGLCDGGSTVEEACMGSSSVALVEAVESIRSMSLKSVGNVAEAIRLNGCTISSTTGFTCRVQCRLQCFLARANLRHAPTRWSSHYAYHHHHHCRRNCYHYHISHRHLPAAFPWGREGNNTLNSSPRFPFSFFKYRYK